MGGRGEIRERERVAEELIENFQSSLSSTITQPASILQSQTESLKFFVKSFSFIPTPTPSERKSVCLTSFFPFLSLSLSVPCRSSPTTTPSHPSFLPPLSPSLNPLTFSLLWLCCSFTGDQNETPYILTICPMSTLEMANKSSKTIPLHPVNFMIIPIYIYMHAEISKEHFFFLSIYRILFHNHTPPWEAFHFSQETKLNTARGLLPIPVVYSLTMKQCSPHFFFLIFLFFLFCPCIRFFSFFVSSPFPLLLRYSIS